MYGSFVRDCFKIPLPLNDYLRKYKEFGWLDPTIKAVDAFNKLESKLVEPSVLALPQLHRSNMIDTDASAYASGAVFLQQRTSVILMSGLPSVTGAKRSIRREKLLGNRKGTPCRGMAYEVSAPMHREDIF